MTKMIMKLREYFFAWLVFVLGSGAVAILMRLIARSLLRAATGEDGSTPTFVSLCIQIAVYIVGLVVSFILFALTVKFMIVKKNQKTD
jgi:hypothetical protein